MAEFLQCWRPSCCCFFAWRTQSCGSSDLGTSSPACCPRAPPPGQKDTVQLNFFKTNFHDRHDETQTVPMMKTVSRPVTHLQLVQGFGSHVGVLEVDKGTEAFMKNSDAFNLTEAEHTQKRLILLISYHCWKLFKALMSS